MAGSKSTEDVTTAEECFLQLVDGTMVIVRPACAKDRTEVIAFVDETSRDSLELRFAGPVRPETVLHEILVPSEAPGRLSLIMETLEEVPRMVGTGEYVRYRQDPDRAEVAFLVADAFQGRGAGSLLLGELARRARSVGVRWFTAVVMAENIVMRDVFLRSGFPYRLVCDWPALLLELDIGQAVEARAERYSSRAGRFGSVA